MQIRLHTDAGLSYSSMYSWSTGCFYAVKSCPQREADQLNNILKFMICDFIFSLPSHMTAVLSRSLKPSPLAQAVMLLPCTWGSQFQLSVWTQTIITEIFMISPSHLQDNGRTVPWKCKHRAFPKFWITSNEARSNHLVINSCCSW
jgi:hypothetical protein